VEKPIAEYDGADPYSSATRIIKDVIRIALYDSGKMSAEEQGNLVAIEEFVRERDNA
jgi:hypothetical protein